MRPHRYLRSILAARWGGGRRDPAARARRQRPAVEPLESRRVLSNITEFPTSTAAAQPEGIAAGPDGRLWFAEYAAGKIGAIDPTTHAIEEFSLPTGAAPHGVAAGPDGKIWFTDIAFGAAAVGWIDPVARGRIPGIGPVHAIHEYPLPGRYSVPIGIAAGPDGNLWFTENGADKLGSIDPATGDITEFSLAAGSLPYGIVSGPGGLLWFTEPGINKIGSIDPTTKDIKEYGGVTGVAQPQGIAVGPDGQLWFAEHLAGRIGTLDPATQQVAEFEALTGGLSGIAEGPDGNLWFTQPEKVSDGTTVKMTSDLGVINPSTHAITYYAIPSDAADPYWIAAGPDGNLWFTDPGGSAVGVLVPVRDLAVTAGPTTPVAFGAAFDLTIVVTYHEGPVDIGFDGPINLSLADSGPSGATLGGTLTATAHAGVATFSGLTLDRSGTYQIIASTGPQGLTTTTMVAVDFPLTTGGGSTSGGGPTANGGSAAGGGSTAGGSPTIVAGAALLGGKGRHKRLVGFELDFSAAMDPARAADPAEYGLMQFRRRRHRLVAKPVRFRASYDAAAHRVELMVSGRPKFAAGGKLVVVGGAGGLTDAAGAPLDGGGAIFIIARKGKGLSR